ncbi:MAG: hypothetical protein NTY33_04635 [Candidatus Moranbacteria bacterium]|nr:hypothetical protein [Candidatus Moranbacteria bacterium]
MPLDLFSKTSLPDVLPDDLQKVILELKKSRDQKECLEKVYALLTAKYHGERLKTYTKLFQLFRKDIFWLWNRIGYLHCTNINYVARILLVKSGFFEESDICLKWTLVWYVSPHQYLEVEVGDQWIVVDIWANAFGIEFGDYAH